MKESRNDSSMLSKVFCVVYQESYVSDYMVYYSVYKSDVLSTSATCQPV